MAYDYSKLFGRMAELKVSQGKLAEEIGISRTSLYKKLRSDTEFTQNEINACVKTLGIDRAKISEYFFSLKV